MGTIAALRVRGRSAALAMLIVIAGVLAVLMLNVRTASASPVGAYPPPPPPTSSTSSGSGADSAAAATSPQIVTKPLASTGSDDITFAYIGGALVVLGAGAVYAARRRTN